MCALSGPAWAARVPSPVDSRFESLCLFTPMSQKYFFLCATKEEWLANTAEGDQEPLLGGPTAPELLPPESLVPPSTKSLERAWL